jgi:hypothetical protein
MMELSDDDMREIFSLFRSCTRFEREQIYNPANRHYYKGINLSEEYELTEERKEYARDAWRAVIYFLYRRGYQLCQGTDVVSLDFVDEEFLR